MLSPVISLSSQQLLLLVLVVTLPFCQWVTYKIICLLSGVYVPCITLTINIII